MDNFNYNKDELAEIRGMIMANGKLTKQAIMEISNISFNLSKQMDKLSDEQKMIAHQMNMLIEECKQIVDESKKIYSGKDMYEMVEIEGMHHADIAKRCGCCVSTVKRRINKYKEKMFNMEV